MLNNKLLNAIKYTKRFRQVKQASLRKHTLTKLALRYATKHANFIKAADPRDMAVEHFGKPNTNVLTTPVNGHTSDGTSALRTYNGALNREDADRLQKTKDHTAAMSGKAPMKHLKPGIYAINSGVFPLPGFRAMGISDKLRHSLIATVHDEKPDVPDAYQLPNGQWVTYFTSNPTSKLPWVGGENLPVWNGHYNEGGMWPTKKNWHKDNEHILNSMVNPNYSVKWGPIGWNPNEFKIDYKQIADGEDAANAGAEKLRQLYEGNKYRTLGPYSYGLFTNANNCVNAAAFAQANLPIPKSQYADLGGGFKIKAEDVDKYKHLGVVPGNKHTNNPSPAPLIDLTGGAWKFNAQPVPEQPVETKR